MVHLLALMQYNLFFFLLRNEKTPAIFRDQFCSSSRHALQTSTQPALPEYSSS